MDPLNVSVLSSLPPVDESGVDALLAAEIARDPHKLVVLDDDPTGVQSLVARLSVAPAFVIAKGGITSSDVGIKTLPEDWKCPRCKQPKEKFNKA